MKKIPPALLTNEKMLQILLNQQKAWENEKIVTIDLSTIEKALKNEDIEASTRTIYRKMQELRNLGLIKQTVEYFKKYQLMELKLFSDMIIVDENENRLSRKKIETLFGKNSPYTVREIGEIKTQLFEITKKGKKVLENLK